MVAHRILLSKNLIYTAITRAKRRVLLIGEKKALYMAIKKNGKGKRNTNLGQRIQLYHKAVTHRPVPGTMVADEKLKNAS